MKNHRSNRIIATPSSYAREHYLYVQETGSLQSIEPHVSRRDDLASLLFFVVIKGSGTLTYQGKSYHIGTGDCIFINCLEEYAHESSKEDPWTLSWVHFYGKEAAGLYRHYLEQGGRLLFHPADLSPFTKTLESLFAEQSNKNAFYEQVCHKYLTDIVTSCYLSAGSESDKSGDSIYQKMGSVRSYIEEHFSENISLDFLSEHFFISKFHLSREFKRINGVTIGNYLNGKRINEAKKLLRFTDQPIGSIAASCGIPDINYFTKVFVKYESMPPSHYRKKW